MVHIRVRTLLVALAALVAASRPPSPVVAQEAARIVVIVNADLPVRTIPLAEVRRVFLLRERFWPDGRRVAPVNTPAGTPLREMFSREVLGGGSRTLAAYWNQLYFNGTLPPPTLASEQAVILYVQRTAGAIGYVSGAIASDLPSEVRRVLTIR